MVLEAPPIPRSRIAIGVEPSLRPRLPELSAGRTLAIDYFATRLCTNTLVGDLNVRWLDAGPLGQTELPDGFVALAAVEGVGLVAHERLLDLLATTGPTIVEGGPPFARHLAVQLEDPAAWIDFLDSPFARRRRRIS